MGAHKTIRVVLVGGSGYAGFEAIRWLLRHPNVELVGVFGPEGETGAMEDFYPLLSKQVPLAQELYDVEQAAALSPDVVLLCVPHKVAMTYVPDLRQAELKVIDWSADYRIKNASVYGAWYCPHTDPRGLGDAVYGLPEYFADDIAGADLVANPGCYPTCAALALAPLLSAELIAPTGIVVNAISGISGAGRKVTLKNHFPERNENFEPYATAGHRHQPEMEQTLMMITGREVELLFQPHLCPMDRGMLATI
ncbi:MAG: N-acetyl-gamma-glutamyl-phosphate reductase, partial [Planctomycetota bacterium]